MKIIILALIVLMIGCEESTQPDTIITMVDGFLPRLTVDDILIEEPTVDSTHAISHDTIIINPSETPEMSIVWRATENYGIQVFSEILFEFNIEAEGDLESPHISGMFLFGYENIWRRLDTHISRGNNLPFKRSFDVGLVGKMNFTIKFRPSDKITYKISNLKIQGVVV